MRSIFLLLALFSAPIAFVEEAKAADWIEGARNCEDFAIGVLKTIATNNAKSEEDRSELKAILSAACVPPFDICNFKVCRKQQDKSPASDTNSRPDSAARLPWFKQGMNCNDFLAQIKTRYQRDPAGLSAKDRGELKVALDLACSDTFAHCNFEACSGR